MASEPIGMIGYEEGTPGAAWGGVDEQQLQQIIRYRRTGRLDEINILSPHILLDFNVDFSIRKML